MISITFEVTRTILEPTPGDVSYQVECEIIASEGIGLQLFVYKVEDDTYSHIATPYDMEAYPTSKAQALTEGLDYYRQSSASQTNDRITDAEYFASVVYSRLSALANAQERVIESFITGTAEYTVTSE